MTGLKKTVILVFVLGVTLLLSLESAVAGSRLSSPEDQIKLRWVTTEPLLTSVRERLGYPPVSQAELGRCGWVEVVWDQVDRADIYELYRDGQLIYRGQDLSFFDTDLIFGQWYRYQIRAVNSSGLQDSREQRLQAAFRCPPAQAPLQVRIDPVEVCGGHVRFSWSSVPEANFYRVERAVPSRGRGLMSPPWRRTVQADSSLGGGQLVYQGPGLELFEQGLEPEREYQYFIWSGNETDYSQDQRTVTVRSSKRCPPGIPTPPRAG